MSAEREMRQVLAELELVSHGRTQKVDANRVHASKDPSSILKLDEEAYPHEFWRNEWLAAEDDESRQEALEGARDALKAIKLGAPLPADFLEPGSFRWKCAIADDDERSIAELARVHSISRQTVKSYREKYRGVARRRYEEEAA